MEIIGIIPARYGSSRLPGKPLMKVKGKSIIQRVYERAMSARTLSRVIVATDDIRIANHVEKFGGIAEMTRQDHISGTTRCAEVALKYKASCIVNIQGDEPLTHPGEIDRMAKFIASGKPIATLVKRISTVDEIRDPSEAKVILDKNMRAIYFSRSPVPFVRGYPMETWPEQLPYFKHVGMYAYERDTLIELAGLPSSSLEKAESLEQLNCIYHGYDIYALETDLETLDIDTPEDLEVLERILALKDS